MTGLRRLSAATLMTFVAPVAMAADPFSIDAFVGSWKGDEAASEVGELAPDALALEIEAEAEGFRISWHDLGAGGQSGIGAEVIDARFAPADRPGVYEYEPSSGSLLSRMFASPATGNPLEGETLIWARIDDQTLAVYSMNIDQEGGFDLDHYSWTLTETGLRLTFSKQTEDLGPGAQIQGDLTAGEG